MIIAQIASMPEREHMLVSTVESLIDQVDRVRIALNNYTSIPVELAREGIMIYKRNNEKGDAEKIYNLSTVCGYVFLCDDDLIYPPDYVETMVDRLRGEDNQCILTCHGRIMNEKPVSNSYTDRVAAFHCLQDVDYDGPVDIGGTGVMAFHSDYFMPVYKFVNIANMLDIWIARFAYEQGCVIKMQPHDEGWIQYQHPEHTIWDDHFPNPKMQTDLYNSF